MTRKKRLSSSELSPIGLFIDLASIGAGAYHGYCDAQGIPFEKENLEWALTYGPAIIQGGLGATTGGIIGLIGGGLLGSISGLEDNIYKKIAKVTCGATLGTIAGVGLGGAIGGIRSGAETLIGYGIGYVAGSITK
jgi:hypothetical protein